MKKHVLAPIAGKLEMVEYQVYRRHLCVFAALEPVGKLKQRSYAPGIIGAIASHMHTDVHAMRYFTIMSDVRLGPTTRGFMFLEILVGVGHGSERARTIGATHIHCPRMIRLDFPRQIHLTKQQIMMAPVQTVMFCQGTPQT